MSATTTLSPDDLPFLDIESEDYQRDPWATVAAARSQAPAPARLFRSARGVELFRYDGAQPLLSDKRLEVLKVDHYAEMGAGPLLLEYMVEGKMSNLLGDRHLELRRILGTVFRRGLVESQRPLYREVADGLIDGFVDRGACDLVADFSHRYPIAALCRAIGVPVADVPIFEKATLVLALTNEIPLHPVAQQIEDALQLLWDYTVELVAQRDREPQDDYVTELAGEARSGTLSQRELVWGIVNLLFGAHDTTRYQTSSVVRALIETGHWEAVAADPELIPGAVEEGMRYYPVVRMITRVVEEEGVVVEGCAMPVGTVMRFNMHGAARDPERFDAPDAFDLHRATKGRVAFGAGKHKCLGHTMARADMEEALAALTARLRDPRITGPIETSAAGALWGPTKMPIAFERRTA